MIRAIRTLVAVAAMTVVAMTPAVAEWHEVKTPNFTVVGDAGLEKLEDMAMELEQFRVFLGIIHAGKLMPPEPVNVPVYILRDERSYRRIYDRPYSGGVYTHRIETPIFLVNAEPDGSRSLVRGQRRDRGRQARQSLKHEYVHHFLYINGPDYYPLWYNEGMADYYSSFTYEDGIAQVGELISMRGGWLIFDEMLDWNRVFMSNTNWRRDEDYRPVTVRDVSLFYAQSWVASHYLMSDTQRRAQLTEYLRMLQLDNADYEGTFLQAFGMTMAEMGEEIEQYLKKNRLIMLNYQLPEFEVSVTPVSRRLDDWEEEMAKLFARRFFIGNDEDVTEIRDGLRALIDERPDRIEPLIELAFLEIDEDNIEVAAELAAKALSLAPDNSMALVVKALTGPFAERGALLIAAQEADPKNPLALYQYALRYQDSPDEKVLDAAIRAMYLSADNENLPLLVGKLLIDLEYYADAREVLQPISKWGSEAVLRQQASYQLERIPAGE